MTIHFIEYEESKICQSIIKQLQEKYNFSCCLTKDLGCVKNNDLIIWFVQNENLESVLNTCANIRKHLPDTTILFVSAFECDKILIGPIYSPNNTSGLDSALFFLYQEKCEDINSKLKLKLPLFKDILGEEFYIKRIHKLTQKLAEKINEFKNVSQNKNSINKIEIYNIKESNFDERFVYPILEIKEDFYEKKKNSQLIQDINFINASKKDFRFKLLNKSTLNKTVAIVGGGTAGYLSAISLKTKHPELEVTLIESEKIPIIGVGEATTPDLVDFLFKDLKLDKLDFYKKVEPTWKLGIKFYWGESGDYTFNYPFGEHDLVSGYINGNIDHGSLTSILMSQDSSFILRKNEKDFYSLTNPRRIGYAFHLENRKFVTYLKNKAIELGVVRLQNTIDKVILNDSHNQVSSLITSDGKKLQCDYYLDCSGFKSLLIDKLDSQYFSYNDNLITDTAISFNVNHKGEIKPYTYAESMKNGWCWNIPLRDSDHRGYVYSSKLSSENDIIDELKLKYPNLTDYKVIRFKSGRHNSFIKGNVAAIGNSYGFVEPLESTGIHMITEHIKILTKSFDALINDRTGTLKGHLNRHIANKWDYLKWFLSIHYKYNKKFDSPFWEFCRNEIDVSKYQHILDLYKSDGPLQMLNNSLSDSLRFDFVDSLFGLKGVDNILLGQGVIPNSIDDIQNVGHELWKYNVNTWMNLSKRTIPLKEDIEILVQNPNLI
ncbi:tryptophan 7-halogenase [Cellulophaga omnivescoria]|uniref:tryptophan 7-halogenase n=1 Tax=Cellulophaga omnivescoria TaxID=1888890 RepID=UPI00098444D2|nr:tryptophan 7-halogenase [Cellulophaga omnivescoria]